MAHGGKRANAGRKSKAEEDKAKALSITALINTFGSEEEAFTAIAREAQKGSYLHFKLLLDYGYGKPIDKHDVTSNGETITGIQLLDVDGSPI